MRKGTGALPLCSLRLRVLSNVATFRTIVNGRVHERGSKEFCQLIPDGDQLPGARAVIVLDIERVRTSCGYSIPFYEFAGERLQLQDFFEKLEVADAADDDGLSPKGLKKYWALKNAWSIDGLPGFKAAEAFKDIFGFGKEGALKYGGVFGAAQSPQRCVSWLTIDSFLPLTIAFVAGILASSIWRH